MASGFAVVKSVPSGDTLLLSGQAKNGPPPEIQITLSSLMAPRLGRLGTDRSDEPFAWASREYLRKLTIGKRVQFRVQYTVASIGRQFGEVRLEGQDLATSIVTAGWAKVKDASRDGVTEAYEGLKECEQAAQAAARGMWTQEAGAVNAAVRPSQPPMEPEALVAQLGKKRVPAVIEYARDAATYFVTLPEQNQRVLVMLAGVQAPRVGSPPRAGAAAASASAAKTAAPAAAAETKSSGGGAPSLASRLAASTAGAGASPAQGGGQAGDPFGAQAKHFAEMRVLHRDVRIQLLGVDRSGRFFAAVHHPAGSIATALLSQGLARVVDWSIGYLPLAEAAKLRAAEGAAKAKQLRVWRGYTPPVVTGEQLFTGTVSEVVSGDTIVVLTGADTSADGIFIGDRRRISLSSVRTPRMGNSRRGVSDEPWAWEAREFLRSRLIGRKVCVSVEYTRASAASAAAAASGGAAAAPASADRVYATVTLPASGKKAARNMAELLLAAGLGETVRHRQDDARSAHYDVLLAAEARARSGKKGMRGTKEPPSHRVTQLAGNPMKARQFMPFLKRERRLRATVEYVYSGSRLKLFIHKENCSINFALGGVACPDFPRGGGPGKAEPFAHSAKDHTYAAVMQREVEVEVETVNQGGTALGALWLGHGGKKRMLAVELLKLGLAKTTYSAERSGHSEELYAAEAEAQGKALRVWANYAAEQAAAAEAAKPPTEETVDVSVSEVVNGNELYLQLRGGDELEQLRTLMQGFGDLVASGGGSGDVVSGAGNLIPTAKKGQFCGAPYTGEQGKRWYRGRVLWVEDDDQVAVRFIDFGNVVTLPLASLRTLDATYLAISPLALSASLAFTTAPELSTENGQDAALFLTQLTWGKPVTATVHDRDASTNTLLVTLWDEQGRSVNQALVREGLSLVAKDAEYSRAPSAAERVAALREAQEKARKERLRLWRYGDIEGEEEEEEGYNAWGR